VSYNASAQALVVAPLQVRMDEGGRAVVNVRLATVPASNVTVTANVVSGSPDVTISSGSTLTFTPSNWATPQAVLLAAATDADSLEDASTLSITSPSLSSENVEIKVTDFSVPVVPGSTLPHLALLAFLMGSSALFALRARRRI
jgi:hypothetical protein